MSQDTTRYYKISKAKEMREQLEKEKQICKFSTIRNYKQLDFCGFKHAGVLSHICSLELNHKSLCKCLCGVEFKGF